jgi:hypothetical protein
MKVSESVDDIIHAQEGKHNGAKLGSDNGPNPNPNPVAVAVDEGSDYSDEDNGED